MLRGIYGLTDLPSRNLDPSIPAAQKLEIIANSPVIAKPTLIRNSFRVSLPFVYGSNLHYGRDEDHSVLYTEYVNVGDKELCGYGIGSRLLRAACRHAIEREPRTTVFATGLARLGLLNTAVKVMGLENVAVEAYGKRYGWQGEQPLESIFDDRPPVPGKTYLVYYIEARIDRDQAMEWEAPVYSPPEI